MVLVQINNQGMIYQPDVVEDNVFPKSHCEALWKECETAAINSKSKSALR
jgi:hypothetical protein